MDKCFVIQPFDEGGPFDRRFDEVLGPAIKASKLEPYRVDRDPNVNIPINDIEKGIEDSVICLAEITTDNPNVWFELGYAIGVKKEVVLICSTSRTTRFPFDVQHRRIIKYSAESHSDLTDLGKSITERINALLRKEKGIARIASSSPLSNTEGLSQHELAALASILQNQFSPVDSVTSYMVRDDMNRVGFTDAAVSIGLRSLARKGFVTTEAKVDAYDNTYSMYKLTDKGEVWLFENQERLQLRRESDNNPTAVDDLPF